MPIVFLFFIETMIFPFIVIVGTYFIVSTYAFGIPTIVLIGLSLLGWVTLKLETMVFLIIALGSVLCSTFSVTKRIILHSPLKNWDNHLYESYKEHLALYLLHPSNIMFVLYLIYFIFLSISGYVFIQYESYIISEKFDLAILNAFLVYIAYTNMRTKAKETDVDVKELLKQVSGLFVHDKS